MEKQSQCFTTLIDRDLPMLRSVAYRITGNTDDADEAIQNAMLSAWKSFSFFRNEAKLSSWIYRITVNASYDLIRKRQAEQRKLKRFAKEPVTASIEVPERRLNQLQLAIAKLPEKYRNAIAVGFLSGFSGEKAAGILGCSVNTLHQRISRAKVMLKNIMEKQVTE